MPVEVIRDKNEQELLKKVNDLVRKKFANNYQVAFQNYDHNHDGKIDKDELVEMLTDALVGNKLTRGQWANAVINKIDRDGDLCISWQEFDWVVRFSS